MLVIDSVVARPVVVPLDHPHRTASGTIYSSPLVLTDLTLSDGTIGHSIAFTYGREALKPTRDLIETLAQLVIQEPVKPRELTHKLNNKFRLLGTQGLVGIAISALDMAMWDALSRSLDMPLHTLLGGAEKPVKAYASIGFDGASRSARDAEKWVKKGFTGVKAKIGYLTAEKDREVVRAIRQAVGDDIAIMVDYNQALSLSAALSRVQLLENENISWIEEPSHASDLNTLKKITSLSQVPIQCGESWCGISDMQNSLANAASDYVMPDVMKIGGVTGWMQAASLAACQNMPMSSHLWPELSSRLLCCTPTYHWLEYIDWWNPILSNPLIIQHGRTSVDNSPGSGIEWHLKNVQKFTV